MNFVYGKVVWIFICTNVIQSTARFLPDPLRISTRHFAPYMYQDSNGHFYKGMEFRFLLKMAEMLNVSLSFQDTSNHSEFCNDVATNVSDICIGGIFPTEDILKYASMSVTYASDDLTWCVRKAGLMPTFWAQGHYFTPTTWFMIIFGYGYTSGALLYFLIQFDLKYKRRNNCDWHRTTWLVTLPAVIGFSPNFQPLKGTVRLFFAFVLITAFFLWQIIFTGGYDDFLYVRKPWRQVLSFDEVLEDDYHLVGTREAFNLLKRNEMIPAHKLESLNICDDVSDCFAYAQNLKYVAIGGSRENMINSQSNFSSQMFCFDSFENIVTYPIALYMRQDFLLKEQVNEIAQQLLESGFFVEWENVSELERKNESDKDPVRLTVDHISGMLVFLACGTIVSTSTFIAENFIYWKKKQQGGSRRNNWIYLERFFDGKRNCLQNLPERLQEQNKNFDPLFPYLD